MSRATKSAQAAECVASSGVAAVIAATQPCLSLLSAAMRETVRHHASARLALQRVVADGGRGLQAFFEIAGFERNFSVRRLARMRGPHAAKAIGLQLQRNRVAV